jgi:hypothetical protein
MQLTNLFYFKVVMCLTQLKVVPELPVLQVVKYNIFQSYHFDSWIGKHLDSNKGVKFVKEV